MRQMFIAAASLAICLAPSVASASGAEGIAERIEIAARKSVADGESPGLQIAVYKDGKPLVVKGYGMANLEQRVSVENDSIFRIGSITKQFSAVALLELQEEGRLSLNDRLSAYYPDFPRAADITLLQMLQHTSGLYNYTELPEFLTTDARRQRTTDEMVSFLAQMPRTQDFEPGTGWHYSNTGYFLLGGVIEKVEGKPIGTVFRDRFFTPLGMKSTATDDEAAILRGRVSGYAADGPGNFRNAGYISMTVPGAGGALRSNAEDLVRWSRALFGGKLLKPATLALMMAPGRLKDGRNSSAAFPKAMQNTEYGMGLETVDIEGHRRIGHGGSIPGFSASIEQFPDDGLVVVAIINALGKGVNVNIIANRIQRIALGLPESD